MYLLVQFTISMFNSTIGIDTQHVNAEVSTPNETQTIGDQKRWHAIKIYIFHIRLVGNEYIGSFGLLISINHTSMH